MRGKRGTRGRAPALGGLPAKNVEAGVPARPRSVVARFIGPRSERLFWNLKPVQNTLPSAVSIKKVDTSPDIEYEKHSPLAKTIRSVFIPLLGLMPSSFGGFIFTAFGKDTKVVKKNATSYRALELIYTCSERRKEGKIGAIDYFWGSFLSNSLAVRNRLKLAKKMLHQAIQDIAQRQNEVKILSLGFGSSRAVIEILTESKNGLDVKARLIDPSRDALNYSQNLAQEQGLNSQFEAVRGPFQNLEKYTQDFQPSIVEMVGLLDYYSQEEAIEIVSKIHQALPPGGWLITCNISRNLERSFIKKSIGWPLVYRTPQDFAEVLRKGGFSSKDFFILYEPLKIHGLGIAQKS